MTDVADRIDVSILVNTFRRPRHLALVLESIALQQAGGARLEVVVSDDGSDDGTEELVADAMTRLPFPVRFTSQPHDGFRLARVRNAAARLARGDSLLFLDGDCMIPPHHVATHLDRRRRGTVLVGYCARLPEQACRTLTPERLAAENMPALVPAEERRLLARRLRRSRLHAAIRHPTKPRLTGGDFGMWRDDFLAVNGFDERFVGWGQEDDDLGLRLRAAGLRLESILDRTWSLHVWHATDPTAAARWRDGPNVAYFERRGRLTACRRGLVARGAHDVAWGLPADVMATPLGRALAAHLRAAPLAPPGATCEIDVVVRPGTALFTRPSECRLVLAAAAAAVEPDLARSASQIATVTDETSLTSALESAG
ncbi:MAG: glycosyltransferase [Pirellulales bacterium]